MPGVLVTGAEGGLGGELVRLLRGHGLEVPALEVAALGRRALDITDAASVGRALDEVRPGLVINCAAYNDVDRAEGEPERAMDVNALAVGRLARACELRGATLVHYSTDYVFDGLKRSPYQVGDEPGPLGQYAMSKLLGERQCMAGCGRHYVIRTSWVFGPGGRFSFPARLLEWARARDVIRIAEDQVSVPTGARDLALATLGLIERGAPYGLYHVTNSGGGVSRYEWAGHVLRLAGYRGVIERGRVGEFGEVARRPLYSVLDCTATEAALGHGLPHWQEAVASMLREM